jgi:hypothetical protein
MPILFTLPGIAFGGDFQWKSGGIHPPFRIGGDRGGILETVLPIASSPGWYIIKVAIS